MPLFNTDKLVFVYNADSGFFNLLSDIAHKTFSPDTYNCKLCMLTHGHLGMHEQWKGYLKSLEAELEFLHRDEFLKKYKKHAAALPALFLVREGEADLFMSEMDINDCETLDALIEKLNSRITELD